MIKAVIIDDENLAVGTLALQLKKYCPQINLIAKFSDSVEAYAFLKNKDIDLLFLDIEMPHLNGFDLLNKLAPISFDVIFTTAYDKFAIRAFKYSAFDYLLKPIDEEELKTSVEKYSITKDKSLINKQLEQLFQFSNHSNAIQKIALPTFDGLEFVEIKSIVRCKADSNYTEIFFDNKTSMVVCRTLKEIDELLSGSYFIRVHHSHLVNKNFIRKIVKTDGGTIILEDKTEIPIARSRKDEVISQITSLIA